jgi:hypothetical protein
MIVDPDFPDHWKTRMLVDALDGDEAAPVYLLRLWAHCQLRKTSEFEGLPAAGLKGLCRYPGNAEQFEAALVATGFIARASDILTVCGWAEYNAQLIANWENGKLGGRPRKVRKNPNETHGLPMENPWPTHPKPIREEKTRVEKNPPLIPPDGGSTSGERFLPKGWKSLTREERKRRKVEANSPTMQRIGKFFGRKPETLWTIAEGAALFEIKPPAEEVDLLARYYALPLDKEADYRRRDLQTLLNNWQGEVDRARSFFAATPNRS